MKARKANLSLRRPACLKTTLISQKSTGILDKWEEKNPFSALKCNVLNSCPCLAKQLLGTCSFIAVYVEYYCTIFDHATCFVLVCFPQLRKAVQQVQENVFTTESFSELELHPHLVSGRKAVCLETCFGLGGGQVRELRDAPLLVVTWTESPGLCLILLESRSSACGTVARPLPKHTVPAPVTVCGYNTKKPQKVIGGAVF